VIREKKEEEKRRRRGTQVYRNAYHQALLQGSSSRYSIRRGKRPIITITTNP